MKFKEIKKYILTFVFLLIFAGLFLMVSNLLEYKTSRFAKEQIKNMGEQVDVLFAGSSHVQNNIYPYYLWKEKGITSYNIASSGEWLQVTYYEIKEALKYTNPKVVVVDLFRANDDVDEYITRMPDGLIHEAIDYFDLDADKVELAGIAAKGKGNEPISFLSNYYAYHDRWKELGKTDFEEEFSLDKGSVMLSEILEFGDYEYIEPELDEKVLEGTGYKYIKKIAALCKEKGCECLFINTPYYNGSKGHADREYTYLEEAKKLGCATLYGPDYYEAIGLLGKTDFYDSGHYNVIGAKKMSEFMADYLSENFDLTDHRGDEFYSSYADFDKDMEASRLKNADESNSIMGMVMGFYDSDKYKVTIYGDEKLILNDEALAAYTELGKITIIDKSQMDAETKELLVSINCGEELEDNDIAVVVRDTDSNAVCLKRLFKYSKAGFYIK